MRKIVIITEIEDSDYQEQQLFNSMQGVLGVSMKDFYKLPDTSELYETDSTFRALCSDEKKAKKAKDVYVYNYQIKKSEF